jgi:hypothetical protein
MNSPELKLSLDADGSEPIPSQSPAEFREKFLNRADQWEDFIKNSGVKVGNL